MPRIFGKTIGKKTAAFLLIVEALFFSLIVVILILRQNHYVSLSGPRPNVVIFLVDSLRADHLGCYGHDVPTSPFLDKLAKRGVLFEFARSQSSWTMPSVASLFTSLYSSEHKLISSREESDYLHIYNYGFLREELTTLAEVFRENGYLTAAFITNDYIASVFNFRQGFDEFFMLSRSMPPENGKQVRILDLPANFVHDKLRAFLQDYKPSYSDRLLAKVGVYKKPFFIYVHYMDVHYPYYPPPPFTDIFDRLYVNRPDTILTAEQIDGMRFSFKDVNRINFYLSRYDGQIRFFDHELKNLLNWIEESGVLSPAIMAFTADHGEAFNEHNKFNHGGKPYEGVIHVPLIIWGTPDFPKGKRVSESVEIIDIAPTLLEASGITAPDQFEGLNLIGTINNRKTSQRLRWSENYSENEPSLIMIDGRRKWIFNLAGDYMSEVYDLKEDSHEKLNLIDTIVAETTRKQAKRMRDWHKRMGIKIKFKKKVIRPDIPDDIKRKLKALGYLE